MLSLKDEQKLKAAKIDLDTIKYLVYSKFTSLKELWNNGSNITQLDSIMRVGIENILPYVKEYVIKILEYAFIDSITQSDNAEQVNLVKRYISLYNKLKIEKSIYLTQQELQKDLQFFNTSSVLRIASDVLYESTTKFPFAFSVFIHIVNEAIPKDNKTKFLQYLKQLIPYPIKTEVERLDLDQQTADLWKDILEEL